MWHSAKAPRSDRRTFFGLHLHLVGRCCKNPLSARGPAQCKFCPGITCLVNVAIYRTVFQKRFTTTSPLFTLKILFKKIAREMLIEQIIESELRAPELPGCTMYMYSYNWLTS